MLNWVKSVEYRNGKILILTIVILFAYFSHSLCLSEIYSIEALKTPHGFQQRLTGPFFIALDCSQRGQLH